MGRRSTNTTKNGKFMNPTDQARKEARKRELKKNKKQRKLVRETVLKLKDPIQIVEEMLRLDMLDLEGLSDNINEKVVEEKKRKLDETLNRILTLYEKTDKEKYAEIKKFQVECDRKRHKALLVYQSQKQKEEEEIQRKREEEQPSLNLTEIALPHSGIVVPDEIPLPTPQTLSLPGIELPEPSSSALVTEDNIPHIPGLPPGLIPPGPPPGSPPRSPEYSDHIEPIQQVGESSRGVYDIDPIAEMQRLENEFNAMEERLRDDEYDYDSNDDYDDDEDEDEEDGDEDEEGREKGGGGGKRRKRKVRFREADEDGDGDGDDDDDGPMTMQKRLLKLAGHDPKQLERGLVPPGAPPGAPPGLPPGMPPGPPPSILPGPPPGAPPRGIPGPPPGRPPGPPPGIPRPPPGMPPMGLPPRLPPPGMGIAAGMRPPFLPPPMGYHNPQLQNVIQKGPEIKKRAGEGGSTTISAKPVLKNLRAEVTKFVPTAVKIRRNPKMASSKKVNLPPRNFATTNEKSSEVDKVPVKKTKVEPTKDDVYAKFMSEMTGFL